MEAKGYVIIFGLMALAGGLIGFGIAWHATIIGVLMIVAGAAIGLYWLFWIVLPVLFAMGSDI